MSIELSTEIERYNSKATLCASVQSDQILVVSAVCQFSLKKKKNPNKYDTRILTENNFSVKLNMHNRNIVRLL